VLDASPEGIGATLVFQHQEEDITIECDPADAVALVVRAHAPIYATLAARVHACPAGGHPEVADEACDGSRPSAPKTSTGPPPEAIT
jgi:hypothetical protein